MPVLLNNDIVSQSMKWLSGLGHIGQGFSKARRASATLDLIHSHIFDPMRGRNQATTPYFITFIDNYSRYSHIYLISHKSEALIML